MHPALPDPSAGLPGPPAPPPGLDLLAACLPGTWEWIAILAAVLSATCWRLLLRHRRPAAASRFLRGPWPDLLLALACLAVAAATLWPAMDAMSPRRAPMGPDSDAFYAAALAVETGRWSLYAADRYPAWPWLVALLSRGPLDLHRAGVELSMAASTLVALPLYLAGRQLGGRLAGLVGCIAALRLPVLLDIGRTFTSYPLEAFLDATMLALGLAVVLRGRLPAALGLAVAAGLAAMSDPKQLPLAIAFLAVAGASVVLRGPGRWGRRLLLLVPLAAALPVADLAAGRLPAEVLSIEDITARVPMRFQVSRAIRAHAADGYRPGRLARLLPSVWRTATGVRGAAGELLDPGAIASIPRVFPRTSLLWLAPALLAAPLLLLRRRGERGAAGAAALLLVLWCSAWPTIRLRYQHRYMLPVALVLPVAAAAGISLAAGPAAPLGAGLVALLLPASPYSRIPEPTMRGPRPLGDVWVGPEVDTELDLLEWAHARLPADTAVFDYSQSRPMNLLAAAFPYHRCSQSSMACNDVLPAWGGTRVAVLWADEWLGGLLPGGTGQPIRAEGKRRVMPERIASCWRMVRRVTDGCAVYRYECDRPPPRARDAGRPPPPPDPQAAGAPRLAPQPRPR